MEEQGNSSNIRTVSLPDTRSAFTCLQKCLHCRKCSQLCKELYTLGQCEHRFCWPCTQDTQGKVCPVCNMPSQATQARVDKQLSSIASFCFQMSDLLNGKHLPSVDERLPSVDKRLPSVDKCLPSVDERLPSVDERIPSVDEQCKSDQATVKQMVVVASKRNGRIKSEVSSTRVQRSHIVTKVDKCGGGEAVNCLSERKRQSDRDQIANVDKKVTPEKKSLSKVKENKSNSSDLHNEVLKTKACGGLRRQKKKSGHPSLETDRPSIVECLETLQVPQSSHMKEVGDDRKTERATAKERRKSTTYLTKRNTKGETPLQVATIKGDVETVRNLLEEGANPNVRDNAGWTPLHEAVNHGNVTIAELLINYGATVNAPGHNNDTPLHDAVINYHLDCVRLLVSRGANTLARNINGHTPLSEAQTDVMRDIMLTTSDTSLPLCDPNTSMNQIKELVSDQPLCILGSVLSKDEQVMLLKCAELLNAKVVDDFSMDVTHLITGVNADGMCPRTMKYLNTLLAGKWVLNKEWLKMCIGSGCRVDEEEFEIAGCTNNPSTMAPMRARQNSLSQLPGLFDGCQFYFHGKFNSPTPSREELASLVKLGGGVILTREPRLYSLDDYPYTIPFHALPTSSLSDCSIFVVYDDTCPNPPYVEAQRMTYLPASWIMDSIASFSLLDKTAYLRKKL